MNIYKFIKRSLLTVFLPVVVFFSIYEFLYRAIPNSYKIKDAYLTEKGNQVQLLILGSSHAYFGIDPSSFSMPSYNAANVSEDIERDHYVFFHYIKYLPNLKYVIIPISYGTFWANLEQGIDVFRVRKYSLYMNKKDGANRWIDNFEFSHIGDKTIFLYYLLNKDLAYCDSDGFGTNYSLSCRSAGWKETGPVAARRHTRFGIADSSVIAKNEKANLNDLFSIINYCNGRNIKVLLVTLPTWKTYSNSLNSEQLKAKDELLNKLKQNCIFTYYDMMYDDRFLENDFFDADHLNEYGARKTGKILDSLINQH